MLVKVLGFELRYHSKQISFVASVIVFFVFGMIAVQGGFGGPEVYKNSPYAIAAVVSLLSLTTIFVSTLFTANAILRESEYKMESILFTTAITKPTYLIARFSGLLIAVLFVLCVAVLGMIIGTFFVHETLLGPKHLSYYFWPLICFGLPNVLFGTILLFATALLTRSVKAIYVSGVLLYILYLTSSILGNSPLIATSVYKIQDQSLLPLLIDPYGLTAFFGQTRFWSIHQRNNELFTLEGAFLLNRILWVIFSVLVAIITYRMFAFRQLTQYSKRKIEEAVKDLNPITYQVKHITADGWKVIINTFLSRVKIEVSSIVKSVPFAVMLLLWMFFISIEVKEDLFNNLMGTTLFPTTGLIVEKLLAVRPIIIILIFFSLELIWRERDVKIHELLDATHVKNEVLFAAKCTSLAVVIGIFIASNCCVGICIQLFHGYYQIDPILYFSLFYYSGFPLLLIGVLLLVVQFMSTNKYMGLLINLVLISLIFFSRRIGIEHYLLRFGTTPDLLYSDLNGFGHYAQAFNWYMLYWTFFILMLIGFMIYAWPRGTEANRLIKLKKAFSQPSSKRIGLLLFCGVIWIVSGAYIFYQTNSIGKYQSKNDRLAWQAEYEKLYKQLANLEQPVITAVRTNVDLYPDEQKYFVSGVYYLQNASNKPLEKIWIGFNPEVTYASAAVSKAKLLKHDTRFNQFCFQLDEPLLPGKKIELTFSEEVVRSGFQRFNNENSVVSNGSYMELEKVVPFLGYTADLELEDELERRKRGLVVRKVALETNRSKKLIDYETIVSTKVDQTIITVGELCKTWKANNRSYFHFKTATPIPFMFAVASARYTVIKQNYKGVDLELLYFKGHEYNINTMLKGMKDALDYCQTNFGPYQFKTLALAELPQYRGLATAYPGVIFAAEKLNFLSNYQDSTIINHTYGMIAHEISHQWWANKLIPCAGDGDKFLTESLAKYTEAMIMEKEFGALYLRSYFDADQEIYFTSRAYDKLELPLMKTKDQLHVAYQKGGIVMFALKELLGEQKVNNVLDSLAHCHNLNHTKVSPKDLFDALNQKGIARQKQLINDWLAKVVVYDLKITKASCKNLANGTYELLLDISVRKVEEKGTNTSLPLPIDEYFDIGVFNDKPDKVKSSKQVVYLKKHHFKANKTQLTLIVNKKPQSVAIDPYYYMLDENRVDNMHTVIVN